MSKVRIERKRRPQAPKQPRKSEQVPIYRASGGGSVDLWAYRFSESTISSGYQLMQIQQSGDTVETGGLIEVGGTTGEKYLEFAEATYVDLMFSVTFTTGWTGTGNATVTLSLDYWNGSSWLQTGSLINCNKIGNDNHDTSSTLYRLFSTDEQSYDYDGTNVRMAPRYWVQFGSTSDVGSVTGYISIVAKKAS